MLAIGAGGLDVAVAMAGGPYYLTMPKVCRVVLTGRLHPMVAAKDIILELLRRVGVKGGVGKIFEYYGEGLMDLSVPERATIANMGAETGATTSIFPSDRKTREFFAARGRAGDWRELLADPDAEYDEEITIDLSSLHPLAAQPSSPDNVTEVSKIAGMQVDQICIGSCTNSSFCDMMRVAGILAGKRVAPNVSLTISPGSRQVLKALAANGALAKLIAAGARILECACGPCIGMGQAPATGAVSLRTFNRNFYGRSGTPSASVYIVSPETAAVSAVTGHITDPETWDGGEPPYRVPELFDIDDGLLIKPLKDTSKVEVVRGPNIKPVPKTAPPGGDPLRQRADKAGRQHNDRPYYALQRQAAALPLQHTVSGRLLPDSLRRGLPRAGKGRRRRLHRGRRELRAGLQPRARRARAALPRHKGRAGEELRAHPPSQPAE